MESICLSEDLTKKNTVCLEKAVLKVLSENGQHPFQLYYEYFKKNCLTHTHANILGTESRVKSEKMARRMLYNRRDSRRPGFFNFANAEVLLLQ